MSSSDDGSSDLGRRKNHTHQNLKKRMEKTSRI